MPTIYLAALAAVVIWGASPVATKIAVAEIDPVAVAYLRTLIGGLAAVALALAIRLPLPLLSAQRRLLAVSASCGFILFPLLFTIGVRMTSANHATIILAALPVFTAAIASAWDRLWPSRLWWLGVLVTMAGEAVLIFGRDTGAAGQASLAGDLVVLTGNLFASLGYVAGARLQQTGYPATGVTFWGAGLTALLLLPLVFLVIPEPAALAVSARAWSGLLYQALAVTIVGYALWYWALGRGGIAKLGLMQFLQPVSGVILAALLLGELMGGSFLLAVALVLSGVWISLRAMRS